MKRVINIFFLAGSLTVIGSAIPISSFAQESNAIRLEEIIVTATRRQQSIQEVALALSVVGEETINQLKPRNLSDLTGLAPNVHIGSTTGTPGSSAIFIRGLGYSDIEKTQNPTVGVSIDGIFMGVNSGQLIDAFDVEQIEISRGPQGIFFGKNTTGGVINVQRSKPTREHGLRTSAGFGSNSELILKAVGNLPLGDDGGVKIGGTWRETDGFTENLFTGNTADDEEYFGINVALDYDLSESLNVSLIYDHFDYDGGGSPMQFGNILTTNFLNAQVPFDLTALPNYNAQTGSLRGLGPREVLSSFDNEATLQTDILNLKFTLDTSWGELVSVTGYIDSDETAIQDFDGTCAGSVGCPAGFGNLLLVSATNPNGSLHTSRPQTFEQFTQEFRLAGSTDKFDYLAGLFYYKHDVGVDQITNDIVTRDASEENTSVSVFGNVDYKINDQLTVSAGIRFIDEEKEFFNNSFLTIPGAIIPLFGTINETEQYDDTITRFGVDWQVSDSNLLYVSRSEGFRSGGFSTRGTLSEQIEGGTNCVPDNGNGIPFEVLCPENNFLSYDPESVTTWELGSKNALFDGQLVLNAAVFQTTIEDLQNSTLTPTPHTPSPTNTYINNLAEAEIEGFELDFFWSPEALQGFTISGVLGIQSGELTDGLVDGRRIGIGARGQAGAPGTAIDLTGSQVGLGRIADYNYTINGTYKFSAGPGEVTLSVGYNYIDDHSMFESFGQLDVEPGYGLVNAFVEYSVEEKWAVSLSGRNLTNEDYRLNGTPVLYQQVWADDANVFLEFKLNL